MNVFLPTNSGAPPMRAEGLQKRNQQLLKEEKALFQRFKAMQRYAKQRDEFSTLCAALDLLEALTGHNGLSQWVSGQFDDRF